jgi:hypothetical protein
MHLAHYVANSARHVDAFFPEQHPHSVLPLRAAILAAAGGDKTEVRWPAAPPDSARAARSAQRRGIAGDADIAILVHGLDAEEIIVL